MRIQYSISTFLSILVIVNACQDGTHQAYMNDNDTHAHGRAKEENGVASTLCEAIVSVHPGAITQNGNGHVSPATSSNDVLVSIGEQLVTTPSQHHETMDAKPPAAEVVQSTGIDEKKEEALQESLELEMWFQRFVDAVDHAEDWDEVAGVLAAGKRRGYLDRRVAWDDDQYTPLHYAAEAGSLKVIKELIKTYNIPVDTKAGTYQGIPLHLAAQEGHLEVVKFLIEDCGAQWEQKDQDGSNALHYAASGTEGEANVEVIKYLIEVKNANPTTDIKGLNMLYLAIKVNNIETVRYLVTEYPVLTTDKDDGSVSPLAFAEAMGRMTAVSIIKKVVKNVSCF